MVKINSRLEKIHSRHYAKPLEIDQWSLGSGDTVLIRLTTGTYIRVDVLKERRFTRKKVPKGAYGFEIELPDNFTKRDGIFTRIENTCRFRGDYDKFFEVVPQIQWLMERNVDYKVKGWDAGTWKRNKLYIVIFDPQYASFYKMKFHE